MQNALKRVAFRVLSEIETGREMVPMAMEDTGLRLLAGHVDRDFDLFDHHVADGIALSRAIQPDERNVPVHGEGEVFECHLRARSRGLVTPNLQLGDGPALA